MACSVGPRHSVGVEVTLDTRGQTREKVLAAVDAILRQNGLIECGIMGFLSMRLGEGSAQELGSEPDPELKKHGVVLVKTTEAH